MFDLPTILYWFQLPVFLTGGLLLFFMSLWRDKSTYRMGIFLILLGLSVLVDMIGEFSSIFDTPLEESLLFITPDIILFIGYCFLVSFSYDMVIARGIIPKRFFLSWEVINIIVASVFIVLPSNVIDDYYDFVLLSQVLLETLFLLHYPYIIYKHNKHIGEQYSNLESRMLYFQPYLVAFYLIVSEFNWFIGDILNTSDVTSLLVVDVFNCVCAAAWTIAVVYFFMQYKVSINLFEMDVDSEKALDNSEANHRQVIVSGENIELTDYKIDNNDVIDEIDTISQQTKDTFERLEQVMAQKEPFLQADLTIARVGEMVDTHPKILSNCINVMTKDNFNHYVNKYRVDYVISLMNAKENNQLTIESIGQMAGFNNNSTFYKAFKREHSMTPKQYYKQI